MPRDAWTVSLLLPQALPVQTIVFIVLDLKAGVAHRLAALVGGLEVGKGVAALDAVSDPDVRGIRGAVGRGHDPF